MSRNGGLGIDMNPKRIGTLLRNPDGVADMLTSAHDETGDSPADIMADVINIQRADNKMIAEQVGVDISINLMTPERAAELLAGTITGNGVELLIVFNELAQQRNRILLELLDDEEHEAYMSQKHEFMHSTPEIDEG